MTIILRTRMVCLAVAAALLPGAAEAAHTVDSHPSARPITVDGDLADWGGVPLTVLDGSLHTVGVSHDRDNLYLMYRFADERLARELLSRGVLLWLNGDGKTSSKHEAYGLRYGGSSRIAELLEHGRPLPPGSGDGKEPRPPGRIV